MTPLRGPGSAVQAKCGKVVGEPSCVKEPSQQSSNIDVNCIEAPRVEIIDDVSQRFWTAWELTVSLANFAVVLNEPRKMQSNRCAVRDAQLAGERIGEGMCGRSPAHVDRCTRK